MTQSGDVNFNTSASAPFEFPARDFGAAVVIYAITLLAYSYLLYAKAQFIWDDDSYVLNNAALRNPDGLRQIWLGILPDPHVYPVPQYYPMTLTSFWLEHQLWSLNPIGYHVVNVLLHATSAMLLWLILRRLDVPGAWVIAAIFAVHPVQVESVAWITERKNVLSGLFYISSLYMYLRFCGLDPRAPRLGSRPLWYTWALIFFVAALLSKSVTGSLPAVVLLVIWWKRGPLKLSDILPLIPFFILAIAMGQVTRWMEWNIVGAHSLEHLTVPQKLIVAGRAPWFYVGKLIWPAGLSFIYPRWDIDPPQILQFTYALMTIGALVALFLLRDRIGRGPVIAALFFVGTLVPALGFFTVYPQRYSFVADHFQYLACIGIFAIVVAIFHNQTRSAVAMRVLSAIAILALSLMTWQRTRAFVDLKSLWTDTIEKNPAAWMAWNNLGSLLLAEGNVSDAANAFQRAVELKPDHGDAITGLGVVALRKDDLAVAEQKFRESLRVAPPDSPTAANAHANLANLYSRENRFDDAIHEYKEAIALEPHSGDWIDELGMIYFTQGRTDLAVECFDRMLKLDPDSIAGHINMGHAMSRLGRSRDALAHWQIAVKQKPGDYQLINSMGTAYVRLGMRDEAIACFRRALEIKPDYEVARKNLQAIGAN